MNALWYVSQVHRTTKTAKAIKWSEIKFFNHPVLICCLSLKDHQVCICCIHFCFLGCCCCCFFFIYKLGCLSIFIFHKDEYKLCYIFQDQLYLSVFIKRFKNATILTFCIFYDLLWVYISHTSFHYYYFKKFWCVNWAIIIIIYMSEILKDFWFICYCHYDIATSLRLALDKRTTVPMKLSDGSCS